MQKTIGTCLFSNPSTNIIYIEILCKPTFSNNTCIDRYEWKHKGSTHIHGFIWLDNAPNMDTLDWDNAIEIAKAKDYFDQYIATWNP
jgi:hypothetical protein